MKNNRANITEDQTMAMISAVGDPDRIKLINDFATQGEESIVLLNLLDPSHIEVYEALHNRIDDFEVLSEVEHSGRYTVFVTVRYIRKGQCKIQDIVPSFSMVSLPRSTKSQRKRKGGSGGKIQGFAGRRGSR